MTTPFQFSTTFTLDKAYLTECYEQTVIPKSMVQAYKKAMIFVIIGMALLYMPDINAYIGSFWVGLGIVEALSVRFARAWWVTRQLIGKSGNNKVELSVDAEGVRIQSSFVEQQFPWQMVEKSLPLIKALCWLLKTSDTIFQRKYLQTKL